MVESAKDLKIIEVPDEDIEGPEGGANEAGLIDGEEGKPEPATKPARRVEGIHLKSVRNIRIEMGKLYRLWWAGKMSREDLDTGRKFLRDMLKAKQVELIAEEAGRGDEDEGTTFAGLKIIHAGKSSAQQRGD